MANYSIGDLDRVVLMRDAGGGAYEPYEAGSGGVTDHGLLTGLADDDHAQYALADGTRGTFEVSGAVSTHAGLTATHGATGAVVGTTNTQTLTNKTLTTPTIGSFANAGHTHADAAGGGTVDHGVLTGLADDDHTQYGLLAGRASGQTLIGGTAASEVLRLQSTAHASKGVVRFGAGSTSYYDEVLDRLSLGRSATASGVLEVGEASTTITSGSLNTLYSAMTPAPASSSSATYRAGYFAANITSASTITGSVVGVSGVAYHQGSNNITNLYGLQLQAFLGPIFGAPSGTPSATNYYGAVFQVLCKSTASTAATDQVGGYFSNRHSGTGTITRLTSAHIEYGAIDAGSTTGTVSTMYGAKVSRRNPAGTNVLSNGTITNLYALYIDGLPTGPTYTNTPHQLYLESNSRATVAIRQVGSTNETNRFNARTLIGADADPATSAVLELQSTTGALLLPRMTTAQRDAMTAVDGMLIYNTTTTVVEAREAGAWVNI